MTRPPGLPPAPTRDPLDPDAPPIGRVEPAGTFLGRPRWRVYVAHGLLSWGPDGYGWFVTGSRAKAEAKARRVLERYLRQHDDGRQPSEVPADAPAPATPPVPVLPMDGGPLDLRSPAGALVHLDVVRVDVATSMLDGFTLTLRAVPRA